MLKHVGATFPCDLCQKVFSVTFARRNAIERHPLLNSHRGDQIAVWYLLQRLVNQSESEEPQVDSLGRKT